MVKVRLMNYVECHVEVDGDEHGPAALNMVKVRLLHNMERHVEVDRMSMVLQLSTLIDRNI